MLSRLLILALTAVLCSGCGYPLANTPPRNATICCFGDSLVEGYGVADAATESYPAVLAELSGATVSNWGASGDTTADGVHKLARFADSDFGIIIVTLGGNDILKAVPWEETQQNLDTLFTRLTATGAVVVYCGVTGPLNPGRGRIYADLCEKHGVLYIPEILDGIRNRDALMADTIHPNAAGYRKMAERIHAELQQADLITHE